MRTVVIVSAGVAFAAGIALIATTRRVCLVRLPAAHAQINAFMITLDAFHADMGRYPTATEGLSALRNRPPSEDRWQGPYLPTSIPVDPWGRAYLYAYPGSHDDKPDVVSYGADGRPGGTRLHADAANWVVPSLPFR